MVWVLPVPVCPYANTVQLKPCMTSSTTGATIEVNTSRWEEYCPKTLSKEKVLDTFFWEHER